MKITAATDYHFEPAPAGSALAAVPVQAPLLVEKLSLAEEQMLFRCEDQVRRGIESAIEAGEALNTIRDKRLYRAEFRTFEDYCASRWKMTGRRARQLSDFFAVRRTIQEAIPQYDLAATVAPDTRVAGDRLVLPENERVVRKLAGKAPAEQVSIWKEAVKSAPGGKVTARDVERVIAKKEGTQRTQGTERTQAPLELKPTVDVLVTAARDALLALQRAFTEKSEEFARCEMALFDVRKIEEGLKDTMQAVRSIGTCHTCKREPCTHPRVKVKSPEQGCTDWTAKVAEFVVCREPSKGSVVTKPRYKTDGGWTTDPDKARRYPSATAAKLADRYGQPMGLEKAQRRFKNSL